MKLLGTRTKITYRLGTDNPRVGLADLPFEYESQEALQEAVVLCREAGYKARGMATIVTEQEFQITDDGYMREECL